MTIAAVVADANVLLSATAGHAASKVFTGTSVEVHTAEHSRDEVSEYLPVMARSYGINEHALRVLFGGLGLVVHPEQDYADELPGARRDLANRDPDDAHVLALARALLVPIWSNDHDFDSLPDSHYPTAVLLRMLGM